MGASFFFYDLETSGISPRDDRVMQFAGHRTDMDLQPVGDPENHLIKMTPDVLPVVDAVLLTGITPQQTLAEGITEAEFLKYFEEKIATPQTVFVGYNNVRFDDEFMRYMHYRNFYDPYQWQWQDGRSRWDLLDVVRMTRALRPDGIKWPVTEEGAATNRLELLTAMNGLNHDHAHDALSDVMATIMVAKLIKEKQPKLFRYLLEVRDKKAVQAVVGSGVPFVYSSGRYASEFEKTTVAVKLCDVKGRSGSILVYDLRVDPREFIDLSIDKLAERFGVTDGNELQRLPVKSLQYNRCPAVAPISVLSHDEESQRRIRLDRTQWENHAAVLQEAKGFAKKVQEAYLIFSAKRQKQWQSQAGKATVDAMLYDGDFLDDHDKHVLPTVRVAQPEQLTALAPEFHDNRMRELVPLYKARNYPQALTAEEREWWDHYCAERLLGGGNQSRFALFAEQLQARATDHITEEQRFILQELQLYAESIMPADADA